MNKELLWKAVKEPLRLLVLAIVPFLIAYFAKLDTEWALSLIVVLRFVDKLLHEYGKLNKKDVLVTGLTRF